MIKKIIKKVSHQGHKLFNQKEEKTARQLIVGQRPIYHVHIRKTAGTSINFAFLSNGATDNVEDLYESLAKTPTQRVISNSKVFVGWNAELLNEGNYSYGFSHDALHKLNIPDHVFKFTCLRDPVKRIVSHYNMLKHFQKNQINHPCMKIEGKWLGNSIIDFVKNAPKYHVSNQLHMFSASFNVNEAAKELSKLDAIIYTEELHTGLKHLEQLTNWKLPISNQKTYNHKEKIDEGDLLQLKEILSDEYTLLDKIKPLKEVN